MNLILVKQAIIIIVQDRNSRDLDCAVTFHKCTELICLLSYHSRSHSCGVGTRLWYVLVKDTRIQLKPHRGRFRLWSASTVLFPLHCIDRTPVHPNYLNTNQFQLLECKGVLNFFLSWNQAALSTAA